MIADKRRPDPTKSLVGFIVGDVSYAVPIGAVKEIVTPGPLTELPRTNEAISGVMDHRGEVVPIISLRARFGLGQLKDPFRSKWILVSVQGNTVGLAVDQVTDVFGTEGGQLSPPPEFGSLDRQRGILGVTHYGRRLTFVLDVEKFDTLITPLRVDGVLSGVAQK